MDKDLQSREVLQHWIDTVLSEASESLSEWEFNFINSIAEQLEKYGRLSIKQQNILEKIYAEKTK